MARRFRPRRDPWSIDESEFYELEGHDERMRFLLRYAVLAPSGHNTQPWVFGIVADGVVVYADYSRRMLAVDPADRELLMSVGAAITNFRVAAAHFGIETKVEYGDSPEERPPVATIRICETCSPDLRLASLFRAIRRRHTNRAPFSEEPLDPVALARVCDVVDEFPDTLRFIARQNKSLAAALIEDAEKTQLARPAVREEIADWIRPDDDEHTDGLRADTLGLPRLLTAGASWFLRRFGAAAWQGARDRKLAEGAAALLLVTAPDDRGALLRAGEALEILLLTIADSRLQYSFLNQPVEVAAMRDRIRQLAGASAPAQLLLRIGNGAPVVRPMPRRPLEHVVAPR